MTHIGREKIYLWAVNGCRLLLAVAFLFSGFVKAIDPLGTCYKMEDYLSSLQLGDSVAVPLLLTASVVLASLEFWTGSCLLWGVRRISSSWMAFLLMCIMWPLTLWIALANPVSDCGCFGDAWVLTNWQTFGKNCLLWLAAACVVRSPQRIVRFVTEKAEWIVPFYSGIFIFILSTYCLYHLPIIDFRPYRIGTDIRQAMSIPEGVEPTQWETLFTLEKDGKQREFKLEEYPDSTWSFVGSRTVVKHKGYEPPIQDFSITSLESGEELTDSLLQHRGYTFLLIANRLEEADDSDIDLINELYDYSVEHGYGFLGITASSDEEIERWRDRTGAEYPFAQGDDIMLKTVIRANPGMILLRDGVILQKWNHPDLPDEYQLVGPLEELEIGEAATHTLHTTLFYVLLWYLLPMALVATVGGRFRRKPTNLEQQTTNP